MNVAQEQVPERRPPYPLRAHRFMRRAAVVLSAFGMGTELVVIVANGHRPVAALAAAITLAGAVTAARFPRVGMPLTWVGVALMITAHRDPIAESSVVVFMVFALTAGGLPPIRTTVVSAGALALMFGVASIFSRGQALQLDAAVIIVAVVGAGALGAALHLQQQYWRALERRAADAVTNREVEANRRVAEERLRIARDLHDIIGHHVAVIGMHLGALEVTAGRDEAGARRSLTAAREAVQLVLSDTQRTLSMLRRQADSDEDALLHPTPDLRSLSTLVESFEQIGLRIDGQIAATATAANAAIGVTAYRVVQEALTNAHRHGTGEAAVTVIENPDALLIIVANPRPAFPEKSHGSGFGLIGMRERVQAAGGTLTIHQDDDFLIEVRLPFDERTSQ